MIRTLSALTGILIVAVGVALARQAMLYAQIAQITAAITTLEAKLMPVAPVDVLCGVSAQLAQVYDVVGTHCVTVHGADVPPLIMPQVCGWYRLHDVPLVP